MRASGRAEKILTADLRPNGRAVSMNTSVPHCTLSPLGGLALSGTHVAGPPLPATCTHPKLPHMSCRIQH